ncbi:MAG: YfiT family bacillithiol transferase [Saprospiraceae bacterium]
MINQDRFRYPIGQFEYGKTYSIDETRKHMAILANFPKQLKKMLKKMRRDEYDVPYRMGGWTVRQVVHHLADSHMNAFIRMKLAIVDSGTTIKPYPEAIWAELPDGKQAPIRMSVRLLSALHRRWHYFMEKLTETDLEQGYFHPDLKRTILMPEALALYAWHAEHHLGHIKLVVTGENYTEQGVAVPQQPDLRPLQQAGHRRFTVTLVDQEAPKQAVQSTPPDATPTEGTEKKRAGRPKSSAAAGATGVEKKRAGRPKSSAAAGATGVEKKRAGRPKSSVAAGATGVEKKRPGRPKTAAAAGADGVEKKGPGRPKAAAGANGVEKKRPGRPKAAAASGADGVEKKRPGRPKAAAVAGAGVEKKRPGRPKAATAAGADGVEKKRPGRPKAKAVAGVEKKRAGRPKATAVAGAEKKRAGRPKATAVAGPEGVEKKRAGRPKKLVTPAPVKQPAPPVNEIEPIISNPDERGFE